MKTYYGDWKGVQGKCYRVWKTDNGYEVEKIWNGSGVIFRADTVIECKKYLAKECMAKRASRSK